MQTNLAMQPKYLPKQTHNSASRPLRRPQVPPTRQARARFEQTNFCRQSLSYCRQSLSTVDKVCHLVDVEDELGHADKLCLQRFCRQTLSAQEVLTDKLCRQTLSAENPPKPGQNADKSCRQTLSRPKIAGSCRKSVDKVCQASLEKVCLS